MREEMLKVDVQKAADAAVASARAAEQPLIKTTKFGERIEFRKVPDAATIRADIASRFSGLETITYQGHMAPPLPRVPDPDPIYAGVESPADPVLAWRQALPEMLRWWVRWSRRGSSTATAVKFSSAHCIGDDGELLCKAGVPFISALVEVKSQIVRAWQPACSTCVRIALKRGWVKSDS